MISFYGFILAAKYTKDKKYLDAAQRIAEKYISSLAGEVIPAWDFRLHEDYPAKKNSRDIAEWDETTLCGDYFLAELPGRELYSTDVCW